MRDPFPVPYVFVGDDAFALQPNFMKTFPRKTLDLFIEFATTVFRLQDEFQKKFLAL